MCRQIFGLFPTSCPRRSSFSHLVFSGEPKLHVTALGTAPFYPDLVGALTDIVAFFQFGRRHFGLVREFAQGLNRPVIGDQPFQPSIAFSPPPKLACSLHVDTSGP
jgi:hypothetical protein